nr:hypothetical protein [Tanacetum cinerariifolium]GEX08011.1 hypothetical protein [Tanacetum cinerariifolium]
MRRSRLMKIISKSCLALIQESVLPANNGPRKSKNRLTHQAPEGAPGSQSESVSRVLSQDYRRKCDAAEKAYKAKRQKELGMLQCRELEFLMIDPSSLPPSKRAIIAKKQAEIMRKYLDA